MEVVVAQIVTNLDQKVDALFELFVMKSGTDKLVIGEL